MNAVPSSTLDSGYVGAAVLGVLAVVLILAVLSGIQLPVITTDRAAFIALAVLGIAMCTLGGVGKAFGLYGWAHPITIAGSVLGLLALLLVGVVLLGANTGIAFIATDRLAFNTLAIIGAVKVGVALLARFVS